MGYHVTQRNENGLGRKAERGNGKELGGETHQEVESPGIEVGW